jgi:hypothetical protein
MDLRRTALAVALLALAPASASAAPPVTTTNDGGSGSLRAAIQAASPGDTITVPAGTYVLTAGQLGVAKPLTIEGTGNPTISGGDTSGIFNVTAGSLTLRGLTLSHGKERFGAAIMSAVSLTLDHVELTDNHAGGAGEDGFGVIDLIGNDPGSDVVATFDHVEATGNVVGGGGGDGFGGLLDAVVGGTGSTLAIHVTDSQITGNTVGGGNDGDGFGGAIDIASRVAEFDFDATRSTFAGNTVADGDGDGFGGALNYSAGSGTTRADFTFTDSTLSGNAIGAPGDAFGEAINITSSGNPAGGVKLTNTTISDNSGGGGAINISTGTGALPLTAVSSTITDAGLAILGPGTLRNTIVAGTCQGGVAPVGPVVVSDGSCGPNTVADLGLDPLAANGGPVETRALRAGSPALDSAGADCPGADARGITRPQGAGCDVGAYEREATAPGAPPSGPGPDSGGGGQVPGGGGGQTPGGGPGSTGAPVRLVIDSFGLTPKKPKAGKRAVFHWRQTRAARVKIVVTQKLAGRRSGRRCVAGRKKGRRCTALVKRATMSVNGAAGDNTAALTKKLAAGSYSATISAPGASATTAFKVSR